MMALKPLKQSFSDLPCTPETSSGIFTEKGKKESWDDMEGCGIFTPGKKKGGGVATKQKTGRYHKDN